MDITGTAQAASSLSHFGLFATLALVVSHVATGIISFFAGKGKLTPSQIEGAAVTAAKTADELAPVIEEAATLLGKPEVATGIASADSLAHAAIQAVSDSHAATVTAIAEIHASTTTPAPADASK